jgi:hypothetical protein
MVSSAADFRPLDPIFELNTQPRAILPGVIIEPQAY